MSSSSRDVVLGYLGVRQWYAKYSLPNAANSPQFVNSSTALPNREGGKTSLAIASGALCELASETLPKLVHDVAPMMGDLGSTDSSNTAHIVNTEQNFIRGNQKKISLSINQINNFFVVYELNDEVRGNSEELFLNSAIQSINEGGQIASSYKDTLSWPVFESKAFFSTQECHYKVILRRWLDRLPWSECKYLLYIGEYYTDLQQVFLDVEADQKTHSELLSFNANLNQIMSSAHQKKRLWELLSSIGC